MVNKSWLPTWGDRGREAEHFRGFKTQIDSLFEDWFGRSTSGLLAPRIDMAEDEHSLTLTAELPGVSEQDIDVSLVGNQLTIKGEKHSEFEEKKDSQGFAVHRRKGPMAPSGAPSRFPTPSIRTRSALNSTRAF